MRKTFSFSFYLQFSIVFGAYSILWASRCRRNLAFEVDLMPRGKQYPDVRIEFGNLTFKAFNPWVDVNDVPF